MVVVWLCLSRRWASFRHGRRMSGKFRWHVRRIHRRSMSSPPLHARLAATIDTPLPSASLRVHASRRHTKLYGFIRRLGKHSPVEQLHPQEISTSLISTRFEHFNHFLHHVVAPHPPRLPLHHRRPASDISRMSSPHRPTARRCPPRPRLATCPKKDLSRIVQTEAEGQANGDACGAAGAL